jgi:hypothetical protein
MSLFAAISVLIAFVIVFWIPFNLFFPNLFSPTRLCLKCGHSGKTKKSMPGSIGIEIILWLFFIIPGVIYSIWRHSSKKDICSSCGSFDQLIPLDSPKAKEFDKSKLIS